MSRPRRRVPLGDAPPALPTGRPALGCTFAVMGQCCYECGDDGGCGMWAYSVETLQCLLYTQTGYGTLDDSSDAYNWHTGLFAASQSQSCGAYQDITACETSGEPCNWIGNECVASASVKNKWRFDAVDTLATITGIGTYSACEAQCDAWVFGDGHECQAWNWDDDIDTCYLLRTVTQWTQVLWRGGAAYGRGHGQGDRAPQRPVPARPRGAWGPGGGGSAFPLVSPRP